jgi:acylphosphatase
VIRCVKCWVSGKVQGVWYRGSTQSQAAGLGVTGYARNLPDGRVEVLACGQAPDVQALNEWLWQGPRLAEVNDIKCEEVTVDPLPDEFSTR